PFRLYSQSGPILSLNEILQRIDTSNLLLQTYDLRAESYLHKGDAATAWMPPMVGLGTYMTPYPFQKVMDAADKGSLMIRAEQEIPNFEKLRARKNYIRSQGEVEKAIRVVTLNDFK